MISFSRDSSELREEKNASAFFDMKGVIRPEAGKKIAMVLRLIGGVIRPDMGEEPVRVLRLIGVSSVLTRETNASVLVKGRRTAAQFFSSPTF